MKYHYKDLKSDSKLYEDYDLSQSTAVYAEYMDLSEMNDVYHGNPLIEALPLYLSQNELAMDNFRMITVPSPKKLASMPIQFRLSSVNALDRLIIPMRWHYELQREIYWCMLRAYENRKLIFDPLSGGIKLSISGQERSEKYRVRFPISEGNPGFSVLGLSGCGKSKAVELALSHLPQVIIHYPQTPQQFIQLPYLYIVCQPNTNMSAIWDSIAQAIDLAIGNDESMAYYLQMKKCRKLNEKLDYAVRLCTLFKVGIIILDEIEFIKTSTRKETLESLLSFNNRTGVALAIIGTQSDKEKLFPTWQMCRRFGRDIDASEYCQNHDEYMNILAQITQFQWFTTKVHFTSEMMELFFSQTKGTIGLTIAIYKEMNKRYLELSSHGNPPEISSDFIYQCAQSCSLKSNQRIKTDYNPYISEEMYEKELPLQEENKSSILNQDPPSIPNRINDITDKVASENDIPYKDIQSAVSSILLNNPNSTDDQIIKLALRKLNNRKKSVKPSPKKKPYFDINNAYEEIVKHVEE